MATAIKIPDLGTNVDHVKIVRWLKQPGDAVKRGDPLCEVETDKATSELESIAEGTLLKHAVPEGTDVEQGTVIAYVGAAGETPPAADQARIAASSGAAAGPAAIAASPTPGGNIQASPMIRNLAKKLGVDLSRVRGTGPGGRILREDLLKAEEGAPPVGKKAPAAPPGAGGSLSSHQAMISRRVTQSHREIPPINLTCRIDLSAVKEFRRRMEEENMRKVSFDAFFVFAVARAVKEFPHFRSCLKGEQLTVTDAIDVGVAISAGEELYTPVVRRADSKPVLEIDTEIQQFAERAGKHQIPPADMAGAVLTISNLGMYPVHSFAAVIPPEQSAALAIGCTEETPVVRDGSVKIAPITIITLSVDHRLINGREAGQFLAKLKSILEKI